MASSKPGGVQVHDGVGGGAAADAAAAAADADSYAAFQVLPTPPCVSYSLR